jgi:multimeric flavodoxin WrbA
MLPMMTVLAISATPRLHGNSDILLDRMIDGCRLAGARVEKVRLRELELHPCTGCDGCQARVEDPCVVKDDAIPLLARLRAADGLLVASPIYFATVNAQLKMVLDRLYSLFGAGDFTTLRGKRLALAFTYGDADPLASGVMNALRMFQDCCRPLEIDLVGWVHACCLKPGEVAGKPEVLAQAEALGRRLVERT